MKLKVNEEYAKYGNCYSVDYSGDVMWFGDDESPELHEMIAALISEGEFYLSERDGKLYPWVNCSDVFAWGCADGEDIEINEIKDLFFEVLDNRKWGSTRWCCKKRNERPQLVIEKNMKEEGVWTDEMESLPPNRYWIWYLEKYPDSYKEVRDWVKEYDRKQKLSNK